MLVVYRNPSQDYAVQSLEIAFVQIRQDVNKSKRVRYNLR